MKVALVHDWLIHMRGGEKVLESFAELYPDATIYTLFYHREKLSPTLKKMNVKASFLQNLPGIRSYYRWLLPILPWMIQSLKIDEADVVLSSSHCVAKGVRIPKKALHLCYCHTPMRYLWGYEKDYFGRMPGFMRKLIRTIFGYLKKWDLKVNDQVDHFISNSENVRKRIQDYYKREATVIHPPMNGEDYFPAARKVQDKDFYLVVSAFVPYKRVDLVIEAFNQLDRNLLIVGAGPLQSQYQKIRKSSKISFLGSLPTSELRNLYSEAQALIFPTDEDFGIVPVEAQACGAPVIAFRKGGALESVKTGLYFDSQTPAAIRNAVEAFEKREFDREAAPEKVASFEKKEFKSKIDQFVRSVVSKEESSYASK